MTLYKKMYSKHRFLSGDLRKVKVFGKKKRKIKIKFKIKGKANK